MKRKYMKTLAVMFCMGTCLTACSPGSEDVAEKKRRLPALIRMEADPSSVWKSDKN